MLVAPHFIDWSAYRADFEREASRILGQKVVVRGDASVRILPFPSVTFSQIEVQGAEPAAPLLEARRFRMDAELAPILSGEVRIFSMRIEEPVLRLSVRPDGSLGFRPGGGTLPTKAVIVLEDVTIADGTVVIDDPSAGSPFRITDLQGTFAAQSLAGPMSGGGRLEAGGRSLSFQVSSGQGGSSLPLKLTLEDRALGATATVDGTAKFHSGAPRFDGAIRAASLPLPKPDATGNATPSEVLPERLLPVFSAAGKFAADPHSLDIADLRLSVGGGEKPYILTGAGSLAGGADPRFSLALDGEQVDIDALASEGGDGQGPVTFERRLEAARQVLSRIPKPSIPGSAMLRLPVVVAGDTTIRDLSFEASPDDTGWAVRRLAAELPGRTRLEAAGDLDLSVDALGFRGSLLVAARQPSGFAEWLTGTVDPAIRTLEQAGFSAKVDLSRDRQAFRDLEVDVGGDTLRGNLERSGDDGARTIAAELRGERLDLDAFVALSRLFTGERDSIADARYGSVKVKAGPVIYRGATAGRIDADLAYDGETLTIDHADIGDLAGSDVTAKGSLADLDGDVSGSVEVTLASRDPDALFEFLSQRLPPSPALETLRGRAPSLAPLALSGTLHTSPGAQGERPTLDVQISGKAARSDVSLAMLFGNGIYAGGSAGRFGLDLTMASTEPAGLLGQFGIEALPLPVPSPLSLKLSVSADATGPVAANAALRAPGSEFTAEGTLGVSPRGFDSAQIRLGGRSDDLTPWLVATGNGFGATGLETMPAALAGTFGFDGTDITFQDIEGSLGARDFTANLDKSPGGPLTGSVFLSNLSAPWLATLAYGHSPADGSASAEWSRQSFGTTLQTLGPFELDVTTDELDLGGSAAAGEVSGRLEGRPGELALSDLRGVLGGGYGTGSVRFQNADGVGAFSVEGDLQGLDLGTLAGTGLSLPNENEEDDEGAPPPGLGGTLDLRFRLDASGQSYAALLSAMTGVGSAHVENATFKGIRPGLLPDILKAADAPGFDVTQSAVSGLVANLTGEGSYPVPEATAELSVVGGVAGIPATRIGRADESLAMEGSVDLAKTRVSGSLRLDLDPGDEAVEGAAPAIDYTLSGPIGAPVLTAGVQPLANFLSVRALEREQARVEAIQSALQEKLRLRREVRLYRWREAQRVEAEETAATAERVRLDVLREREAAEAARRAEEEAARVRADEEAARAERRRIEAEEAARAREEANRKAERPEIRPAPEAPSLDLDGVPIAPLPPREPIDSSSLPGVRDPFPEVQGVPVPAN